MVKGQTVEFPEKVHQGALFVEPGALLIQGLGGVAQ